MKNKKKHSSHLSSDEKLSVIYRVWKRRRKNISLLTSLGILTTGGIGVGIGYAIWHKKNGSTPPIPSTPVVLNFLSPESNPEDWVTCFGDSTSGVMTGFINETGDNFFAHSAYNGIDFSDFHSVNTQAFYGCASLSNDDEHGGKDTVISFEDFDSNTSTSIGEGAFWGCARITNIILPKATTNENVFSIGNNAFWGCTSLTEILLPDNGSTADISIGGYAFRGCANLEDFTLSNGNTSIGNYAFWGCINLQMLSLSETPTVTCKITSIGTRAFQGCASLSILGIQKLSGHIASNLNYVSNGSEGAAIVAASTETWIQGAGLISGNLGDKFCADYFKTENSIGIQAFDGCASLKAIDLTTANANGSIASNAFNGCVNFLTVELPVGIATIGTSAFYGCAALNALSWHNTSNPTFIGLGAFYGCASLATIYYAQGGSAWNTDGNISVNAPNCTYTQIPQ